MNKIRQDTAERNRLRSRLFNGWFFVHVFTHKPNIRIISWVPIIKIMVIRQVVMQQKQIITNYRN